jgi:hypothetical protein
MAHSISISVLKYLRSWDSIQLREMPWGPDAMFVSECDEATDLECLLSDLVSEGLC